jgi:HK97 family phage prohead protease
MPAPDTRRVTATALEIRTNGSTATIEGYASTFGQAYSMGWYDEEVRSGAFTKTLSENPDVRYLLNHDGLALARTASGTLDLAQDSTGLHTRARVNMERGDVRDVVHALKDGDLDQMSFGFRTIKDEWDSDYTHRSMQELSLANGDVSVVTYPANPNTTVSVRARQILDRPADELRAAFRAIHEERAGKTISAATQTQLEGVLASLATIDDAADEALVMLSTILGVPNPDTDEAAAGDNARSVSGLHPSIVRERLRLAGLAV